MPVSGPSKRWNAICVPSGDHVGLIHSDGCRVSWRRVSLPSAFTYKSKPLAPGAGLPFQAKAILEPSGEKAGEVARPDIAVNGTAVKTASPWVRCGRCHRYATTAASATTKTATRPAAIFNHA